MRKGFASPPFRRLGSRARPNGSFPIGSLLLSTIGAAMFTILQPWEDHRIVPVIIKMDARDAERTNGTTFA